MPDAGAYDGWAGGELMRHGDFGLGTLTRWTARWCAGRHLLPGGYGRAAIPVDSSISSLCDITTLSARRWSRGSRDEYEPGHGSARYACRRRTLLCHPDRRTFPSVKARSVPAGEAYPPLTEAVSHRRSFSGTMSPNRGGILQPSLHGGDRRDRLPSAFLSSDGSMGDMFWTGRGGYRVV